MADFKFGRKIDKDIKRDDIVGAIDNIYENSMNQMKPQHESWLLNMSYVAGDQYKYIDPATNQMKEWARIEGYEEREVYNKIRNLKNTYKARITQKKPFPFAIPVTTKEKDKRIASITNAVLDEQWEKQNVERKIDIIGEYLANFGCTFMKVTWDKEAGDEVIPNLEGVLNQIQTSAYLEDEYRKKLLSSVSRKNAIYEGDVRLDILSPFEFFVDSVSRRDMSEVQYCLHSRVYHKDILKRMYDLSEEDLPEQKINSITLQEGSFSNGANYIYSNNGYKQEQLKDHNILHEYYERPSNEYPKGRFIVVAGTKVVHSGELPYEIGPDGRPELPFIRIVANEEIGNFYGSTPISDLRGLQRRFNAVQNRRVEALSRIGVGQWLVAENSVSKHTKINNRPGQIISYKLGRPKPERLSDNTNLTEFREETNLIERQFPSIAGFSAFDPTQASSAMRSATQMSMLFEQEDLRMSTPILNIANGIKTYAKYTIRLLQQFTVGKRFVKYQKQYDENLEWDKDLINDNIIIKNINALAKSPAQQQQMLMDLMGMGAFDEQNRYGYENTLLILEQVGMGTFKADVHIPNREDIEKAKRENHRASKYMRIAVDKIVDNHSVHIREHSRYLKSEEYEELLGSLTPEQAIIIEKALHDHIAEHQQILKVRANNLVAQQRLQQQTR